MKFKVDENLPDEVARMLSAAGHESSTVLQEQLGGSPDSDIANVCKSEQRTLITLDTGFTDLRRYPPADYAGLVVLRLQHQDKPHVLKVLRQLLDRFTQEEVIGRLWVVEEHRIRIR